MDRRTLVVCAVVFVAQAALAAADVHPSAGGSPTPLPPAGAIRSVNRDPRLAELLAHGMARSVTLQGLVASLEASDVIVYVSFAPTPARNGYLVHQITVAGPHRYLRVLLEARLSNREVIPLLAHELQHALEVAQSPHVRDREGIKALFERIGFPSLASAFVHETEEALRVQRRVRADLRG
jgi:hypothetical protein